MDALERQQMLMRPMSIEDSGLTPGLIGELAVKVIYNAGEISGGEISRALRLPFVGIVQPVLEMLDREEVVGVTGAQGFGAQAYRFTLSRKGIERAHQVLERSQYVGPAPVPIQRYNALMRAQAVGDVAVGPDTVAAAFSDLVISPAMLDKIGPALNSGRSVFLYGPPGNGKTLIATRMASLLGRDPIFIPYAVSVDSYIIKVYDTISHRRYEPAGAGTGAPANLDERWVLIERPSLVVGGELSLASLDLIWDPTAKYYEAPFQMKANGGMFLIDDFGRQQMAPRNLLNRWILPLETRIDFLTLHTGKKIEIPFEELVVFSTNMDPTSLVDEAFLRRIRHKIKVDNPTEEEFHRVFEAMCRARGVTYTAEGYAHLVENWYRRPGREFKNSHPRDILDQLLDITRYQGLPAVATPELIDAACSGYFADL